MSFILLLRPSYLIFQLVYLFVIFLFFQSVGWCSLAYLLTNSFCFEETILKSEILEFYVFTGLLLLTCGVLGFSLKALLLENTNTGPLETDTTPPIEECTVVENLVAIPENVSAPLALTITTKPVCNDLFKFVRYKLDFDNTSKVSVNTLVDFVSPKRLDYLLKEIEIGNKIILKYNSQYSRPGEDLFEDGEKIYKRFQFHKEEVSSFSHGNNYDDWFYASSILDEHRQTLTLLIFALITKPGEYIDEKTEMDWDYEIWQSYMFECQKSFAGAKDVLNYAEELVRSYRESPELFTKIEPIFHLVENGPTLKVIYLWDKMVESARAKKASNTEFKVIDSCISTIEPQNTFVEVLKQQPPVIEPEIIKDSVQPSFYDNLSSLIANFKTYLISFFF